MSAETVQRSGIIPLCETNRSVRSVWAHRSVSVTRLFEVCREGSTDRALFLGRLLMNAAEKTAIQAWEAAHPGDRRLAASLSILVGVTVAELIEQLEMVDNFDGTAMTPTRPARGRHPRGEPFRIPKQVNL